MCVFSSPPTMTRCRKPNRVMTESPSKLPRFSPQCSQHTLFIGGSPSTSQQPPFPGAPLPGKATGSAAPATSISGPPFLDIRVPGATFENHLLLSPAYLTLPATQEDTCAQVTGRVFPQTSSVRFHRHGCGMCGRSLPLDSPGD